MLMYRKHVGAAVLMIGLLVYATSGHAEEDVAQRFEGQTPDATVDIDEVQLGYMVMGTMGGATLHYQGKDYRFKIGGLGVGGVGVTHLKASGRVYGLKSVADFAGLYGDARIGIAATIKGKGNLWLHNTKGVYVHLHTHLEGLALTLGADAITFVMDE